MENSLFKYYKNATSRDLCQEYRSLWRNAHGDKELLVRLAMRQQAMPHLMTFAYEGQGLTMPFVTEQFKDYINGLYTGIDVDGVDGGYKTQIWADFFGHVYVDQADVLHFLWCDTEMVNIKKTKGVKMYVGCNSSVNIVCDGYNFVTVMLFDESKVVLDDVDADSIVIVYRYSDKATVEQGRFCLGKVMVHDKTLRI